MLQTLLGMMSVVVFTFDDVPTVVAQHDAIISSIFSIHFRASVQQNSIDATSTSMSSVNRYEYWHFGERRRAVIDRPATAKSKSGGVIDSSTDGRMVRQFFSNTKNIPEKASPGFRDISQAKMVQYGSSEVLPWYESPRMVVDLEIPTTGLNSRLPLAELVRKAKKKEYVGFVKEGKREFHHLRLEIEGDTRKFPEGETIDLYLEPQRSWWVGRYQSVSKVVASDGKILSKKSTFDAVEYMRSNGYWIPTKKVSQIEHREGSVDGKIVNRSDFEYLLTEVEVNAVIPESQLTTQFPELLLVDGPIENGKRISYLWGKDGPLRTMRTKEEYEEMLRDFPQQLPRIARPKGQTNTISYVGLGFLIAGVIGLVIFVCRRFVRR